MAEGEGPSGEATPQAGTPVYYWDACVFLAYIEGTPGRVEHIDMFLEDAAADRCIILTSILSTAEVAFGKAEKDGAALDPETEARIDSLWHPSSPIRLVEAHLLVTLGARALLRSAMVEGLGLKPADAIHLATAIHHKVNALHTYDNLAKYERMTGLKIREPIRPQGELAFPPSVTVLQLPPGRQP